MILNVMLEAAAVAERVKLRKRQAIGSLVQRRSRFMVSPGELKGSIRREGIVRSICGVRFSIPAVLCRDKNGNP
ncbi:MAG: hypothetical protein WA672_20260, partial [Candidatus Angelobacter sp.]